MGVDAVILGVVLGTLAAIVYSLRVLVLLERRIARIDTHIESLVYEVLRKEDQIQEEERNIARLLSSKSTKKPASKAKKKPASKAKKKKK